MTARSPFARADQTLKFILEVLHRFQERDRLKKKTMIKQTFIGMLPCLFLLPPAFATNGMNLEGYGPVAAGMGGSSMAYDNGTAAVINNPATLALMPANSTRFDLAAGFLGPHIKSNGESSSANAFFMPALGIIRKMDRVAFGFGVFGQGGMGTEYPNAAFYGGLSSMMGQGVSDPGLRNRSEVGVGRMILPLAWQANDQLTIGGSMDYVWASMDLQMLIDGAHFGDLVAGNGRFGSASGSLINGLQGSMQGGMVSDIQWGYFDFSNNNSFFGKVKGQGVAGKIGATYRLTPEFTIGATWHSKTALSDLKTDSANMVLRADYTAAAAGALLPPGTPAGAYNATLTGSLRVVDFEWPQLLGLGFSWQANDRWQWVGDYRWINWSKAMKRFQMRFDVNNDASNGPFAGKSMDMSMRQDWRDQHVLMLGVSYRYDDALTLRGGINIANNPVPSTTVHPLFPAIMTRHLTAGAGYAFTKDSSLDFSLTYASGVKATNDYGYLPGTSNVTVNHRQINAQLMFSQKF